jgi:hypothetical protein
MVRSVIYHSGPLSRLRTSIDLAGTGRLRCIEPRPCWTASPCASLFPFRQTILLALSAGPRSGVIFKGGAALETLAAVNMSVGQIWL